MNINSQARKNVEFLSLNSIRTILADKRISKVVSIRVSICFMSTDFVMAVYFLPNLKMDNRSMQILPGSRARNTRNQTGNI